MGVETVLQLAKNAADELSLTRPAALIGSTTSSGAQKLEGHLRRTCRMLAGRHDWSILRREKTHTTLAQETQTGAIPSDFLRFITGTDDMPAFWNRTAQTRLCGPLTSGEWQSRKAAAVTGGIYSEFYVRGTSILAIPTPTAGHTWAYEYITKNIGYATDGTTERASFTVDTDTTNFDDELVILGMVWRYQQAEGQDYTESFREFELRLMDMIKMDGGKRLLRMGGDEPAAMPRRPTSYTVT
jgi:hypothetical protein